MKKHFLPLNLQFFAEGEDKDVKGLLKEIESASQEFAKTIKKQEEEIKNYGQVTDKTANKYTELEKKYETLEKEMATMKRLGSGAPAGEQVKSAGQLFVESDAYKNMVDSRDKKSAPVQVDIFERKALTSVAGSAGTLIVPNRTPGVVAAPDQEIWFRDLLNVQGTDTNAIEFVRETGFTNNAAPVAEGDLKPESDLTFDVQTQTVKTIAHWIPATRQALNDARQLQNYIDNRLRYGLRLEEERQILYGDGTGENLQGFMTADAVQDAGAIAGTDNQIDHLRRSLTRVILAGYPATGVVMHPTDWEAIELMKGNDGHYLWLNLGDGVTPRLFRLPVVQTPAMAENDYLMGSFGLGAQLWDREQTEVRIGEPGDYFLRNMQAILAEERIALTIYRPESFVRGTLAGADTGA